MKYYKRFIEEKIKRLLKSSGAIEVSGPKFCGKTTTCKQLQKSMIQLADDNIIEIVEADPKAALIGEKPHLIDEWQNVPEIWDYVRKQVDEDGLFGEFILTGSATPVKSNKIHHTGAGRITSIKMRPMSLYESKDSLGKVSLNELFNNDHYEIFDLNEGYSIAKTAFYICRGGWPLSLNEDETISLDVTRNYYEGLFNFKNSENNQYSRKRPEILRKLLKSYARNISSEASYQTILNDIVSANQIKMESKTFDSYLNIAKDLFIIEDLDAWTPSLRSKVVIRTTPTRHFIDPSLGCQALEISPNDLLNDANTFGLFFEDLAIRDLRIYAETLDGKVSHYRDNLGLECDAVIHLRNGKWGAIEIKLGSEKGIEDGAKHLNKLEAISLLKPSFKMILTSVGKAYKRKDGVYVVPINLLKN